MRNGMVFASLLHVALVAVLVYGLPDSSRELTLGGGAAVPVVFERTDGQAGQANDRKPIEPPEETSAPSEPAAPDQNESEPLAESEPAVEDLLTATGTPDAPAALPQAPPVVSISKLSLAAPEQPDLSLASLPDSPETPAIDQPETSEPPPLETAPEDPSETPPQPTPALQSSLAVPPPAPKRHNLPDIRQMQQAAKPAIIKSETGRQEQTTQQNNAADLIAGLAQDGLTQQSNQSSSNSSRSRGAGGGLSPSGINEVGTAIQRKWNFPCGQRGINDVEVQIRLEIHPDGRVSDLEVVNNGSYESDATYRVTVDSAKRAVISARPEISAIISSEILSEKVYLSFRFPLKELCGQGSKETL